MYLQKRYVVHVENISRLTQIIKKKKIKKKVFNSDCVYIAL